MGRYSSAGRINQIVVGGKPLDRPIVEALTSATLDVGRTAATQITLTVVDRDLQFLERGVLAKGTPVTYGRLKLSVRSRSLVTVAGGTPALQVKARPIGWGSLRKRRGSRTWSDLSATDWAREAARGAGMGFVGEPTPKVRQILRKAERGKAPESEADVLSALAQQFGLEWFEAENVLYFARPSWLARNLPTVVLRYDPVGTSTTPGLLGVPELSDSDDDEAHGFSGSVRVTPDLAEDLTPARAVLLRGVGPFSVRYLPQSWSMDFAGSGALSVSLATPTDPEAEPDSGGDTGSTAGSSGASIDRWVLPVTGYAVTSRFGDTSVGIRSRPHEGIDFNCPKGTKVHAVTAGVVIKEDSGDWHGNRLQVRHPDGTVTWYCHLSKTHRHSGHVDAGEFLALSGATGNVTGAHLHFEVHPGGGKAVDPLPWLRGKGLRV